MVSATQAVVPSGVMAMSRGLLPGIVIAVPSVGVLLKLLIGHALPLLSATQAVVSSGVMAMPVGPLPDIVTAVPSQGVVEI